MEPPALFPAELELLLLLPPVPALTTSTWWLPASTVAYPVIWPEGTPLKTVFPSMLTSYLPPPLARLAKRTSALESDDPDVPDCLEALWVADVPPDPLVLAEPLLPVEPWASVNAVSNPSTVTPALLSHVFWPLPGLMSCSFRVIRRSLGGRSLP